MTIQICPNEFGKELGKKASSEEINEKSRNVGAISYGICYCIFVAAISISWEISVKWEAGGIIDTVCKQQCIFSLDNTSSTGFFF